MHARLSLLCRITTVRAATKTIIALTRRLPTNVHQIACQRSDNLTNAPRTNRSTIAMKPRQRKSPSPKAKNNQDIHKLGISCSPIQFCPNAEMFAHCRHGLNSWPSSHGVPPEPLPHPHEIFTAVTPAQVRVHIQSRNHTRNQANVRLISM